MKKAKALGVGIIGGGVLLLALCVVWVAYDQASASRNDDPNYQQGQLFQPGQL